MNGIGEIILVVVLLAAGIIQNSIKKKRKQQERNITKPEKRDTEKESPFREVLRGLLVDEDPFDFGNSNDAPQRPDQAFYVPVQKPKRSIEKNTKTQNSRTFHSVPTQEKIEIKTQMHENEASPLIQDFDIRKAIIYTEIMTPKFKE